MATYNQGDSGAAVQEIQNALIAQGYNPGPADGQFGAKTTTAVKAFQTANGLTADGAVGPATSAKLLGGATGGASSAGTSSPSLAASPLVARCVALTGSFETSTPPPQCFSGLTGNFDGQGISFGALQQNFGQGSLQPLLNKMIASYHDVIAGIFGDDFAELQSMLAMTDKEQQVAWAAGKQTAKFNVVQPWNGYFVALGQTTQYQAIQADAAGNVYEKGLGYCRQFGLKSERAAALLFDIVTQNGSINATITAQINSDFAALPPDEADETPRLQIIANRRAEAAKAAYVEDVRTRKLTIANGHGVVHGMTYDLATEFGITLNPAADLA